MKLGHKGSALFIVMLFLAIGIAVLAGFQIAQRSNAVDQKTKAIKASYINFLASLRATLEDPHSCEVLLRGQLIGGNAAGATNASLVIGALNPSFFTGGAILAGWRSPNGDFTIAKANLITLAPWFRTIRLDRPSPSLLSYRVRINFEINVPDVNNRQFLASTMDRAEYQIDLVANVDPTGQIYSCHGVSSKAEACELAGGAYDGSSLMDATPSLRCHPYLRCWVEQSGVRSTPATPLPGAAVPPFCPWPYNSPSWIGRVGGQDLWVCEWCNNGLWTPGVN